MKRYVNLAGILLLLMVSIAQAGDNTWSYPVPSLNGLNAGDLIQAADSNHLTNVAAQKTDGAVVLPGWSYCTDYTASTAAVPYRITTGNFSLRRTSAATETHYYVCDLNSWLQRATANHGIKITSLKLIHAATVANISAITWRGLRSITYAAGTPISVGADLANTPTFATVATSNVNMDTITPTTPMYYASGTTDTLIMEWSPILSNTGVYDVFGVLVNFSRTDN